MVVKVKDAETKAPVIPAKDTQQPSVKTSEIKVLCSGRLINLAQLTRGPMSMSRAVFLDLFS